MYFTGIDKARFRRPVVPGDRLVYEVEIIRMRSTYCRLRGEAIVDGRSGRRGDDRVGVGRPLAAPGLRRGMMSELIHPTAVVDARAELASGVRVGPHAVVGPDVTLGEDTEIGAGAQVMGPSVLGRRTVSSLTPVSGSIRRT